MASPASFKPLGTSTPEITITEQKVTGEELRLPAPMELGLTRSLTFHGPDNQKKPAAELQPMLLSPRRTVDSYNDDSGWAIPKVIPPNPPLDRVVQTYGQDGKILSSIPAAASPASLRQRPKLLSELKRSISTSHLGHLFHHPRNTGGSGPSSIQGDRATVGRHSGTQSPLPDSPDAQELFRKHDKKTCPDLEAVSRALNSLRVQSRPGDNEYITSLTRLATSLELSRADSKKALIQAMQARDAGRNEVCRSLCLSIVQNSHADIDTRVYSYNILSTLASPGQAMNYLAEAYALVQENQDAHPECAKLLGVIALLKDGAIEKDGGRVSGKAAQANDKLCELSMPPTIPREISCPQKKSLEIPKENMPSGMLTPKSEKIVGWAKDSKPLKPKPNSLWADLSI